MKVYKLKEVQEMLGLSKVTMLKLIHRGDIKAVRVGDQWRITEIDFNEYMGIGKED